MCLLCILYVSRWVGMFVDHYLDRLVRPVFDPELVPNLVQLGLFRLFFRELFCDLGFGGRLVDQIALEDDSYDVRSLVEDRESLKTNE